MPEMKKAEIDYGAGAVAGLLAGAAYLAEMAIDLKAARYNTDDLIMLGRMATPDKRLVRQVGLGVHVMNSAIFGIAYAWFAHDRLPGPPWLRGVTVASIENAVIYPLALLEQRHPGIRNGELAPYWNRIAFLQGAARHFAFGAALGAAYPRLRARRLVIKSS
jgi:hypothetical protein